MITSLLRATACIAVYVVQASAADYNLRVPVDVAIETPHGARLFVDCRLTSVAQPIAAQVFGMGSSQVVASAIEQRPFANGRFSGTVVVDVDLPANRQRSDVRGYICRLSIDVEDAAGQVVNRVRADQWSERMHQPLAELVPEVSGEIGPQRTGGDRPRPPRPQGPDSLTGGQRPRQ